MTSIIRPDFAPVHAAAWRWHALRRSSGQPVCPLSYSFLNLRSDGMEKYPHMKVSITVGGGDGKISTLPLGSERQPYRACPGSDPEKRAAGDTCLPPPHARPSIPYQRLLAAAAGSAATLLLRLRDGSRALVDTAQAGALAALAGAGLAAAAALTLRAADSLAAIDGGYEGHEAQRCPEKKTVHGNLPWIWNLNRSIHVPMWKRGKASSSARSAALVQSETARHGSAVDSVPPHAK